MEKRNGIDFEVRAMDLHHGGYNVYIIRNPFSTDSLNLREKTILG
jgi:hypothetical protein